VFSAKRSSISVVIPTYNREEILCNTIRDLIQLKDQFDELIIVDQTLRHQSDTELFLSSVPSDVKIIKIPFPNTPNARNVGARAIRSDIVLYLDDDIKPLPSLIKYHLRHYEDQDVGGVAGKVISPDGHKGWLDPRYYSSRYPWLYLRFDQNWDVREVEGASGGNMSFRRELILRLDGFDTHFAGNCYREETDFCLRLRNSGYKIIFDPDASVIHYYESKGGAENFRFGNTNLISFLYYINFFHNNFYFILKHVKRSDLVLFILGLYRAHIANKENLK